MLDPSYGDGRFLRAAADRLTELGIEAPHRRVFGAELDIGDRAVPSALRDMHVPGGHLLHADFFATDLSSWDGRRFDAIVGNPPYVRHHLLSAASKQLAQQHARRVGITLNERADAWAYFCAALLDYLEPRGRLALLLPGAVLHAEYALPLLHALSVARGRVRLIRIQQRLFEEVAERTVVLLIDGQHPRPGVDYREVDALSSLQTVLAEHPTAQRGWRSSGRLAPEDGSSSATRLRTRLRWFVSAAEAELWERISELPDVHPLGDVAEIRIGVVTGANRFFVLSHSNVQSLHRSRHVRTVPIVGRGGWLRGLRWTGADQLAHANHPTQLLVIDPRAKLTGRLREAVIAAEAAGLHRGSHCRSRAPWYSLTDWRAPDLFLPYMGASPPPIVINQAEATCTNAIHRVTLRETAVGTAAVAAASWTTLYRLSAELIGRSYGGGVLKLEPGEAAQLRLMLAPGAAQHALEIEEVLRAAGPDRAREVADKLLLRDHLGLSAVDLKRLRTAAERLRERRGR